MSRSTTLAPTYRLFPPFIPPSHDVTPSPSHLSPHGASTGFLIGFGRQTKLMFDPVRVGAAAVYLLAMVLTLVAALYVSDTKLSSE